MATNFFGPVQIGTKVDVEAGGTYIRTKVEAGGNYVEFSGRDKEDDDEAEHDQLLEPVTDEDVKRYIDIMIPQIVNQNHWYAIVRPLMWRSVIIDGDYEGAVSYIRRLYPDGLWKCPTTDDLRRLDACSMRKSLDKWSEDDAPIHGARFYKMHSLATAFLAMLSSHRPRVSSPA